jgi:hypothetical protein
LKFSESGESLLRLIQLETAEKMDCNHADCESKRKQWVKGARNLEQKEDDLRKLLENHELEWGFHSEQRENLRKISARQSTDAFNEGFCIHFSVYNDPKYGLTNKWLWLGYAKIGAGLYRPLHLPIIFNIDSGVLKVGTVYDPSVHAEWWNDDFTIRQCFNKPSDEV